MVGSFVIIGVLQDLDLDLDLVSNIRNMCLLYEQYVLPPDLDFIQSK